jgi:hypothetical protein
MRALLLLPLLLCSCLNGNGKAMYELFRVLETTNNGRKQ